MAKHPTFWRRFRTWALPPICVLAGVGLGVGLVTWRDSNESEPFADFANSEAGTQQATASLETIEKSVSATGTLAAVTSDTLAFTASGKVLAVNVEAGDVVAEGDVLATIDTLQLTADLKSAQADLAQAEATLANLEDAADGSDASDAQIASAEANVTVKEEAVADAKDNMDGAELVAPIDGLVTSQPYAVGDAVSGGASSGGSGGDASLGGSQTSTASTGIVIVGQDEWTVSVSLTGDEVDLIEVGNQVTFTADDVDDFFGLVTEISALPSTTSGTATYPVTLQVTGNPEGLFEGVSVTADIVYMRKTEVLTVPTNAITTTEGTSTVTVVAEDGSTEERTVTTGETNGTLTEITDGLAEGETVQYTVVAQSGSGQGDTGEFELPDGFEFPEDGQFPGGGFPGGGEGGGPGGQLPGGNG